MKIVCDSCGAKYSIADEKVAGKIFKIRCKKCSSVLEVRGDQTGAQALDGAAWGQKQSLDAGWYIVVDGEQRGPLPPIELSQLFAKGSVGLDSYVWKEGFDDWKVAGEVPELVQILGGVGSAPRRSETAKIATDSTTSIGAGGDLFSDGNGREPTGEIETHDNMFTGLDESPAGADNPEAAPLAASQEGDPGALGGTGAGLGGGAMGAAPARMTGQRNENSVLFSLSNLQQLASRGGSTGGASAQPVRTQAAADSPASDEGSGLIDIRALAKSTTPGTKATPSQAVDDLLSIGASAGGGTLGAPLLGPTPMETSDGNRWLWIAGAAIAMIAIVGAGVGVGMALGGSGDDGLEVAGQAPTQEAPVTGSNAVATAVQASTPAPKETTELEAQEPEEAPVQPLEAPALEEPVAKKSTSSSTQRSSSTKRRRARGSTAASAPTAEPAPAKRRSSNNLDALMDEVVGGSSSKKTATTRSKPSSGGSSLAVAPSRNDVKTALQGVSGGVKACSKGTSGTAVVDVTFGGSTGRVTRAKVTSGPFKGTPVGGCIEKAVKRARVPRFKQSSFKVKFPYRL